MHHRVHMTGADSNGNIGLSWNMLKQVFGASLHAVHVGDGMFAVHVVHYIEVAHFIIRCTTAERTEKIQLSLFYMQKGRRCVNSEERCYICIIKTVSTNCPIYYHTPTALRARQIN